jgi:nitrate reductase assembly molybdenum cofactor insertion protein NarJ
LFPFDFSTLSLPQLLAAQKDNATLKDEAQKLRKELKDVTSRLQTADELLAKSQQPYNYLVNMIRQVRGKKKE